MRGLTKSPWLMALTSAALVLGACGGGEDGERGPAGAQGPAGEQGPAGNDGEAGDPGQDGNDGEAGPPGMNGTPGDDGLPGEDGQSALVRVDVEAAGNNCPQGGVGIYTGIDDNNNGVLDPSEEDGSPSYVCSGDGMGGAGNSSIIRIDPVIPGADCASGGVAIFSGVDTNKNGVLEASEEDGTTSFVCNGVTASAPTMGAIIMSQADAQALQSAVVIQGDLIVRDSDITTLSFPNLRFVTGNVAVYGNDQITTIDLGSLELTGGFVSVDENPAVTTIDLDGLTRTGDHLYIGEAPALTTLSLSALNHVGRDLIISTESSASIDLNPAIDHVGFDYYYGENNGTTQLTVGPDAYVGDDFVIHNNMALASLVVMPQLFVTNDLYVTMNPALPTAQAEAFAAAADVGGDRHVAGNQ